MCTYARKQEYFNRNRAQNENPFLLKQHSREALTLMEKDFETQDKGFLSTENETLNTQSTPNPNADETQPARPRRRRIQVPRSQIDNAARQEHTSFRPEGFGKVLGTSNHQESQQHYRPRFNRYAEGEQGENRPMRTDGYRPRYNNQQHRPGYRPYNSQQPRDDYQPRHPQGYRPRYNQEHENERPYRSYRSEQQQGFQPRSNYHRLGQRPNFRQHTADYDPNAKYSQKKRIEYREEHFDPTEPIRLNKYLANAGICSRREADEYIQSGLITVNGVAVNELGTKVLRTDEIRYNGELVSLEKKVYVLLNKPKGYVTTSDDPQQRQTVLDLVKDACPERIYPVGRLDRNTTGVLLLTNDGDLASKLTHPKFLKKKIYHVFLDKPITAHDLQQIAEGIELEDGEIHADAIEYADEKDKTQVGIEIHSGKNRIVRRIFESLGYHVVKLDRVQFAGLTKKNLRRGDWRFLTEKEVDMLRMGAFE